MSLKKELDATALQLLKAVQLSENTADIVDIFKAVSVYYLGSEKASGKKQPAEEEGNFSSILARVNPGKTSTGGHA